MRAERMSNCGIYGKCRMLSTSRSGKVARCLVSTETMLAEGSLVGLTDCLWQHSAPRSALANFRRHLLSRWCMPRPAELRTRHGRQVARQ